MPATKSGLLAACLIACSGSTPPAATSSVPAPSAAMAGGTSRAAVSAGPAAPRPRPMCGERAGESVPWVPLPHAHPAYRAVRRFAGAFATRDVAAVAAATGLPLRVRYPKAYADDGRRVTWALDERATTPAGRRRALRLLLARFGDRQDEASQLGESRLIDMAPASTRRALRVRVCVDYEHAGDGTFDELELVLVRERAGAYAVREVQVGWFEQR